MLHIVGHRGASAYEPENTLRSFKKALDLGVTALELDVQLTRDGRLAVIHDETVDRTTNGHGRVKDFTLAELRQLDAGLGERIPALEEVVDLVKGRAGLLVELKQPDAALPALRLFREHRLFDLAYLISFWHPAIKALKEEEPRLRTGALLVGCPADPAGLARAARVETLVLQYAYVNAELVAAAHAQDIQVFVWNIDTVETLKPYLSMNLDGIGSNRPDVLIKYVKELGGGPGT
jgi:glycerophosphoryl diester phosphodiesterase